MSLELRNERGREVRAEARRNLTRRPLVKAPDPAVLREAERGILRRQLRELESSVADRELDYGVEAKAREQFLGIRPDLVVDLRLDVLREADGPMLQHGLQGFQGVRIAVPHDARLQPNREWLAERYEVFARAS